MSNGRPLRRRLFDRAERAVGRPLEYLVSTRAFNDVLVVTFRAQNTAYGLFERQTRAVLHFWNLPARTDVTRLHRQVGALSAEVRELAAALDERRQQAHDPATDGTGAESADAGTRAAP